MDYIKLSQLAVLYNPAELILIDAINHRFKHHNDKKLMDYIVFPGFITGILPHFFEKIYQNNLDI